MISNLPSKLLQQIWKYYEYNKEVMIKIQFEGFANIIFVFKMKAKKKSDTRKNKRWYLKPGSNSLLC